MTSGLLSDYFKNCFDVVALLLHLSFAKSLISGPFFTLAEQYVRENMLEPTHKAECRGWWCAEAGTALFSIGEREFKGVTS